jgi:cold shock CspA family protein
LSDALSRPIPPPAGSKRGLREASEDFKSQLVLLSGSTLKGLWVHSAGRWFAHISAVERSGLQGLKDGQKVSYEPTKDRRSGKTTAENLQAL